jgi:hypothetical protein
MEKEEMDNNLYLFLRNRILNKTKIILKIRNVLNNCAVIIHFARTFFERKLDECVSPVTASQRLGGHQRKMFFT